MNTITKAVILSAALTLPAISGVAYSHQQGNNSGGMMMSPEMMEQMMASGQHQNMPMMDHQGMQKMMQSRMQHMVKMEQHLENIESLLAQLLEVQKSK